ncbi:hypothetical protein N7499_012602 [Penicillium canescens]|uniref:uncharacterized protein n=1 Tax=Penicillium canescens TaxID=5083 RepID=UPI0026DED9D5|nr:uncharacterized protein N7446_000752 [Penicillium canescens]KAJ6060563.1 hypothetical protein N7444_002417 [Penicillium canescens]KAJ6063922.1 hypothetical protein N7499_012602 [Penicillium canescens]KAJ6077816.1 hypothetical protein N7446_000752 [Penicillium canescens]KAJ6154583.1 hypothetical protein N7485_012952 [Penicillium canescens]
MRPDNTLYLIGVALLGLTNAQIKPGPRPSSGSGIQPGGGGSIQPGPAAGGGSIQPGPAAGGGGIQPGPAAGGGSIQPGPAAGGGSIQPGPAAGGGGIQPGPAAGGGGIQPGPAAGGGSIQPGPAAGGGGIQPGPAAGGGSIQPGPAAGGGGIQPGPAAGGGGIHPGPAGGTSPGSWTCPNPPKAYNQSPPITTSISCPASDGSIYEALDGSWYYLQCCTQSSSNALSVGTPQVSSMKECLNKCSEIANCETVSFEPSTLYCNLLDFGSFSQTSHGSQLYAFPTSPRSPSSPIYVSPYGETFYMSCGMRHGTPYLNVEKVSTLEDCMDHCAASPSCSSVDFDQSKQVCYLSNNDSPPTLEASRFASAHSVGCSGACEGCGKQKCGTQQQPKPNTNQCVDNQLVYVANHPFRVKCNRCYTSTTAPTVSKPEAKTHEECMQLYVLEANNYVGANWEKNGGCVLKPVGSTITDNTYCTAAFVPLWK